MPTTTRVKLAQVGEQTMRSGIEVCGLLGNLFTQALEVPIHEKGISYEADTGHWSKWTNIHFDS